MFITTYGKPYAAVWTFQPLATGTAILAATLLTSLVVGLKPRQLAQAIAGALTQIRLPLITTMIIVGLAYLMNYSGMAYTLGVGRRPKPPFCTMTRCAERAGALRV